MRGAAVLVVGGCYTGAPVAPPAIQPEAPPRVPPCEDVLDLEPERYRDHRNMAAAEVLDLEVFEGNTLSVATMNGPFPTRAGACPSCTSATQRTSVAPWEVHVGDRTTVLAHVGDAWWIFDAGATVQTDRWCRRTVDAPRFADLHRRARGAEVLVRSVSSCTSMNHPDPKDASVSEAETVCGIGPSNTPSCAVLELGTSESRPEWSHHTRMRLECDGTIENWHWQFPDYVSVYVRHYQMHLVFP